MIWTKILPIFLVFTLFIPVQGKEQGNSVVFLIDLSGSMKTSDVGQEILDAVAQCISMLPSNYQVSILGFNDGLVVDLPFATLTNHYNITYFTELVQNIPYSGYSNTGLGILSAVERLEDGIVIFFSDGELIMPTQTATNLSKELWLEGIELAKERGVSVSTVAVGDWENSFLLEGLKQLDGAFYPDSVPLSVILQTVLQDNFGIPLEVCLELTVEDENILWNLPVSDADLVYLLVQSDKKIKEISWNEPDLVSLQGDYYNVLQLAVPINKEFLFHIKTLEESQVILSLWGELQVFPVLTYIYEDILSEDGIYYKCNTTAHITFVNQTGEAVFLEEFSPTELHINGEVHPIVNGMVSYPVDVLQSKELEFTFNYAPIVITSDSLWLVPEATALEEVKEFSFWWYIVGGLAFVTFVVLIAKLTHVPTEKNKNISKKNQLSYKGRKNRSKYPYVGTLKLELTVSREDFPMKQFSLFRVVGHRPITLEEIVATCYDIPPIETAENITFSPWKEKSVSLIHESSATLLYNQTILRKNQRYTIPVGATIEVSFGEVHQLVIIYDLS